MGDLFFSTTYPQNIYLGYNAVSKIMIGENLVWPRANKIDVLTIAGGGGGGYFQGGGGGGGQFIYLTGYTAPPGNYLIEVGIGGIGGTNISKMGSNGGSSRFGNDVFAYGGGGGGSYQINLIGSDGGNGGGGGLGIGGKPYLYTGFGYSGGTGYNIGPYYPTGGGGGAGEKGKDGNTSTGFSGNGGSGLICSISGSAITYAGGGGGGTRDYDGYQGYGGNGGGGNGGQPSTHSTPGVNGKGGGGGGAGGNSFKNGSPGGSGIVIVKYITSTYGNCSGGTISTSGIYTIHTFQNTGVSNLYLAEKVIDSTPPTIPTNFISIKNGVYSVYLSWSASYDLVGVTQYIIYSSQTLNGTYSQLTSVGGSYTNITYNNLSNGEYYFKITAKDAKGNESGKSSPTSPIIIDDTAPFLYIDTWSENTVDIFWHNGGGSNSVYRSPNGTNSWALKTTTSNNFWQDSTVIDGDTYYYRVTKNGGTSYSNIVVAYPGNPAP